MSERIIGPRLVVALDFDDIGSARGLVQKLDPSKCRLKVGKEMFTRFGPDWVEWLQGRGFDVFLDLKFHDIPNTVARSLRAAADLGVWMVNVHASGGSAMLKAARDALSSTRKPPLLIAVTVLTSMTPEELQSIGVLASVDEQVHRLATLASDHGLDGVVCSAQEAAMMKKAFGPDFCVVTPGIRPSWSASHDQKRITTPKEALSNGSDFLVVGRPVTQASDPTEALDRIVQEMAETDERRSAEEASRGEKS